MLGNILMVFNAQRALSAIIYYSIPVLPHLVTDQSVLTRNTLRLSVQNRKFTYRIDIDIVRDDRSPSQNTRRTRGTPRPTVRALNAVNPKTTISNMIAENHVSARTIGQDQISGLQGKNSTTDSRRPLSCPGSTTFVSFTNGSKGQETH